MTDRETTNHALSAPYLTVPPPWRERGRALAKVAGAMKSQPELHLMWVQGLYDLTCPADLGIHTIGQDGIPSDCPTTLAPRCPHSASTARDKLSLFTAALRKFVALPERTL